MVKKILVVDDEPDVRDTVKTVLEKNNPHIVNMKHIKKEIEDELKAVKNTPKKADLNKQEGSLKQHIDKKTKDDNKKDRQEWVSTGIEGFDALLDNGLPIGASILVCGGPGSGKTIFGLQTLVHGMEQGEKCLYMTFEERPERLMNHMYDFGWDGEKYVKEGKLKIQRYNPYDITRQVEAMLEKAKGELLIDIKPILFPADFKPDRVVIDSLSAIASAFVDKDETYRIYIEQLFRIFEEMECTSFMISETSDQKKLTTSGVEEFLADGLIFIYNVKHGNIRESAIECLKLRGAGFQKKIASMQIISGKGIEVYPEQEVFSDID